MLKFPAILVIRNTGIYTVGNMLPQVVNVLLLPVFTRYLAPADYGILNYTTALNAFFFIAGSFCLHSYLLRHYFECGSEEERRRMFGTIFLFLLGYNFLLLGVEMLVLPGAMGWLKAQVPFYPFVKFAILLNFVEVLATIPMVYFRVRQQALRFVLLSSSRVVLSTGLSLWFVVGMDLGVVGRFYGLLGEAAVSLAVFLTIIFRVSSLKPDWKLLRAALAFCWPILPGAVFLNITTMSDRLFLERFVPLSELGLYALAATISSGLSFFTNGLYRAVEPEIFRASRQPEFNRRVLALKKYLVLVLLLAAVLIVGFSRELVTLLAASRFHESHRLLALLVVPVILQGIAMPVNCYLLSIYQTRHLPWISLAGATANVTANLLLVPALGVYGAALSAIISSGVMMAMYKFYSEGSGKIRWGFGRDLLLVSAVVLLGFGVSRIGTPDRFLTVAIKVLLVGIPVSLLSWRLLTLLGAAGGRRSEPGTRKGTPGGEGERALASS